ncbi:FHA domain-containing protein DDL, partial [Tetrabaena socialis]
PQEQPNMGLSGKLAAETNKVAGGVVLKHVPPAEARKADKRWRLYIFKNDQLQDEPFHIHRSDHYLFGRDVSVADIITAHPSCSKQHAVLQFRLTEKDDEYGLRTTAVRPYLLDLGSVNGTFLNAQSHGWH